MSAAIKQSNSGYKECCFEEERNMFYVHKT